jgi:uncharacterized protein (DUF58 family)
MNSKRTSKYLLPQYISKLKNLEIKAKTIVEGLIAGLHKSPHHGFNVEFKEHRQYFPGDDIKFIDWRVYAKTDKFFIKRYEEETNLAIYTALDSSNSMSFQFNKNISKFEYAKYLTASILYLALIQNDLPGLTIFSDKIIKFFQPRNSYSYINDILKMLENIQTSGKSDFKSNLIKLAENIKRRSLVIIISDFLLPLDNITEALNYLKSKKNDIILFIINDQAEIDFPFNENIKFIDLETAQSLNLNSYYIKETYKELFQQHYKELKSFALKSKIDICNLTTNIDLGTGLYHYLIKREKIRG